MLLISSNQKHAVVQPRITTSVGATANEPTALSTSCAKKSKMLCPQQRKPKPEASIWVANTHVQCEQLWKNSATLNPSPDPLSRPTTILLKASHFQNTTETFQIFQHALLVDRINQGQFDLIWAPGKFNLADYFTKHHPPWHHRNMRYKYIQRVNSAHNTMNKSVREGVLVPRPTWHGNSGTQFTLTTIHNRFPSLQYAHSQYD